MLLDLTAHSAVCEREQFNEIKVLWRREGVIVASVLQLCFPGTVIHFWRAKPASAVLRFSSSINTFLSATDVQRLTRRATSPDRARGSGSVSTSIGPDERKILWKYSQLKRFMVVDPHPSALVTRCQATAPFSQRHILRVLPQRTRYNRRTPYTTPAEERIPAPFLARVTVRVKAFLFIHALPCIRSSTAHQSHSTARMKLVRYAFSPAVSRTLQVQVAALSLTTYSAWFLLSTLETCTDS